jgi:predicted NodU family carbamoyl transferase
MRDKINQDAKPKKPFDPFADAMQQYQLDLYPRLVARSPTVFKQYMAQGQANHDKTLFPGQVSHGNTQQENDQ